MRHRIPSYCLRTGEKATDARRCSRWSFEHGRVADIGDDPDGDIGHGSITIAGLCASVHLIALTEYDECRGAQLAEPRVMWFLRDEALFLDLRVTKTDIWDCPTVQKRTVGSVEDCGEWKPRRKECCQDGTQSRGRQISIEHVTEPRQSQQVIHGRNSSDRIVRPLTEDNEPSGTSSLFSERNRNIST